MVNFIWGAQGARLLNVGRGPRGPLEPPLHVVLRRISWFSCGHWWGRDRKEYGCVWAPPLGWGHG